MSAAIEARIEALLEMLEEDPDDALGHFLVATELSKLRDFARAALHYRQVLALDLSYSAAYRGLGRSLMYLGQTDDARATLASGIEIAEASGDLQTVREMEVFLKKIDRQEPDA